jgi:hypothetical protein
MRHAAAVIRSNLPTGTRYVEQRIVNNEIADEILLRALALEETL